MKKLTFHNKKKVPLHRLPFVGGKSKTRLGINFWNVPASGGYAGGCDTGTALAWLWIKHLEEFNSKSCPFTLSSIATDMSGIEDDSIRGQMVGFFSIIETVFAQMITSHKIHYSKNEKEFLASANKGLAASYYQEESENVHS